MESEVSEATVSGNSLSRMASGRSGLKSLISSVRIEMAGQQKTNRHCRCLFQTNPEARCSVKTYHKI